MKSCGNCTVCCGGVLNIEAIDLKDGRACSHLGKKGCTIYADRPEVCVKFNCAWKAEDMPIWMRPDLSGAMVFSNNTGSVLWEGALVDQVYPVSARIPGRAMNYLKDRANKIARPFIFMERANNKLLAGVYGSKQFQLAYPELLEDSHG